MAREEGQATLEVQSANESRDLEITVLELELKRPLPAVAVGGAMCWTYDIADAVVALRRSELEARLGRVNRMQSVKEITQAARTVFTAVEDRLRIFAAAAHPVHAPLDPWRLQTMAKCVLRDRLGSVHLVRDVQREAAGDEPLTPFGRPQRSAYEVAAGAKGLSSTELRRRAQQVAAERNLGPPGLSYSHGDGCGRTHFESQSPYKLFTVYCPRCRKMGGNRQRAVERRLWARAEGRSGGEASTNARRAESPSSARARTNGAV